MTNSVGAVVERYRYDAYGKRTVTNAAGTPIAASTIGQQRGFTGYYLDAETGLYYARARMYSAGLGRFINRDPAGYVDGSSLYNAHFVPNQLDPSGEKIWNKDYQAKCGVVHVRGSEYSAFGDTILVNSNISVLYENNNNCKCDCSTISYSASIQNTSKEPEKFPVKLFYKKGWGLFYEEKVNPFRFLSGAIERTFDPSQYTFWPDFENSYGFASITVIVKCGDEIIETIEFTVTGDLIRDGLAVNPGSSPMGDAVGVKTVNVEPGIDK